MSLSLYEIEGELQALLDTEEGGIDEGQREEFERLLVEAQMKAVEKRENLFRFLASLEAAEDALKAEEARLAARRKRIAAKHERLRTYVASVISAMGQDEHGKYRKLAGKTCAFSLRKAPDSVEITDGSVIPAEYLTEKIEHHPRKADIKKALQAGKSVPGAVLVSDKYTLHID